jgi:hypothetical protein
MWPHSAENGALLRVGGFFPTRLCRVRVPSRPQRNIAKYWEQRNGFQHNLHWIISQFGAHQPGGQVTIHTARASPATTSQIQAACKDWAEQSGIRPVQVQGDLHYDFHDRYFRTQQGWWQSHRGVDLTYPKRSMRHVRDDAELHWMRQGPRRAPVRPLDEKGKRS